MKTTSVFLDMEIVLAVCAYALAQPITSAESIKADTLYAVAHGKGTFIAVGSGGAILTSADGKIWMNRNSGVATSLRAIAFVNGMFVAVGDKGTIWSSGGFAYLHGVTFANDRFVAVGSRGAIMTSPDGACWNWESSPTRRDLQSVAYGEGVFVAVGSAGAIVRSANGDQWTVVLLAQ
jgi:hypothetical protein